MHFNVVFIYIDNDDICELGYKTSINDSLILWSSQNLLDIFIQFKEICCAFSTIIW